MNYTELYNTIQSYTENQFPDVYLASGSTVSATTQINTFITQAEQRIYNSVQFPSLRKNQSTPITINNKYVSLPNDFLSVYSLALVIGVTGANLDTGTYEYLLNKDVNFIRQAYPSPNDTGEPKYYALFGPTIVSSAITNELSLILGPTPDATYYVELHYYYYPESIVQRPVATLSTVTGGSAYTNGTYLNVALTGGAGSGAVANIVVSGNAVTSVTLTQGGSGYVVGNALSAAAANIGGTGTGFSVPVLTVGNALGTSWLGDNFDSVLLYGSLVEAYTFMKGEQDIIAGYNQKYMEALALAQRLGDGLERSDAYRSGQYRQSPLPQNSGVR
jgi:hypothetical protein